MQGSAVAGESAGQSVPTNRFLGLKLAPGVKARNMLTYLWAAMVTSGYAGGMAFLQPSLLSLLKIEAGRQAIVTTQLQLTQEGVFIVATGLFGSLAERAGRRAVYVGGLLVAALGYALYPSGDSVGMLFVFRFVYSLGGAAILAMMVTVIADYAHEEHRGKANGIQGLVVTLGAFIPLILTQVASARKEAGASLEEAVASSFHAASVLGAVTAVIAFIGLARRVGQSESAARTPLMQIAREGLAAAKDPGVGLSYGAAFISRGDLAVTGAFMMLWAQQYAEGTMGLDAADAMKVAGGKVMGATIGGALIGAILMGILNDRVRRVTAVSLSSGLASMVYIGVFTLESPFTGHAPFLLLFMGVAELSAFISSQVLCAQQAPADRRGSVTGFFGAAGALGMAVGTGMGGFLFEAYGPSWPFIAFGLINLLVFVWSLLVRSRIKDPVVAG